MADDISTEVAAALTNAWNEHDMSAFARLFDEDAAFVNIRGAHLRGRDAIEQQHAAIHAGPYKNSRALFSVEDSREVAPGLVVAHIASEIYGRERASDDVQRALMSLVIDLRGPDWTIVAAHNTLIVAPPG